MRNFLLSAIAILPLVAAGCVTAEETMARKNPQLLTLAVYDDTVPWPRSGVYAWWEKSSLPADPELADMDVQRMVRSALGAAYEMRGFSQGTPPNIDFYVAYRLIGKVPVTDAALDAEYAMPPAGRWLPSRGRPQQYAPGSLVIDIVCTTDYCPRWRGSVSTGLYAEGSAEDHQRWLDMAARLVLRTFPPPGAELMD